MGHFVPGRSECGQRPTYAHGQLGRPRSTKPVGPTSLGRGQRAGHPTPLRRHRRHGRGAGRHAHGRTSPHHWLVPAAPHRIGLRHLIPEGPHNRSHDFAERSRYFASVLLIAPRRTSSRFVFGVNESCHRAGPPALHGVKSTARLATTSGGFAIVEVRPTGEPARTSCSAQGLPSPELDPASPPVEIAVRRTTQRRRSQGTKPRA